MEFDHVAINVSNISNSIAWYSEELSAKVLYADDTWAMLEVGSTKLALTLEDQHPPHVAFRSSTPLENAKMHRDGSMYVYKPDPDGNIVEIITYELGDVPP